MHNGTGYSSEPQPPLRSYSRVARNFRTLLTELQAETDWPDVMVNGTLLLYDMMVALDLDPGEVAYVLGREGLEYIATVLGGGTE